MEWVSVKDRLPNPKDMSNIGVLVCKKSVVTGRSTMMDVARWNSEDWMCYGKEITPHVTHWQPLPQPPKEDE